MQPPAISHRQFIRPVIRSPAPGYSASNPKSPSTLRSSPNTFPRQTVQIVIAPGVSEARVSKVLWYAKIPPGTEMLALICRLPFAIKTPAWQKTLLSWADRMPS
jgi:hypothetical protein